MAFERGSVERGGEQAEVAEGGAVVEFAETDAGVNAGRQQPGG